MPIVVDYTPAGAMMGTAFVVGQQRRADTQAAMDFQAQQAQLNRGHEIAMQRTNNEMKLLDQNTQMQFAMAMQQQKVQSAMQMELSTWQNEQQKLDMAIRSIEDSDAWTPEEKSELIARTKVKFAGGDIPDRYGQLSSTMSNLVDKGNYYNSLIEQGKQWISGGMSVSDAQTVLAANGVPKYLLDKLDVEAQQTEKVRKLNVNLEAVQKQLQNYKEVDAWWPKSNYESRYNPKTKKWDKQTPEDEKRVVALKKSEADLLMQIEQAQSEEADVISQNLGQVVLNETSTRIKEIGDRFDEMMMNPEVQKMVWENFGGDGETAKQKFIEDTLARDAQEENQKKIQSSQPYNMSEPLPNYQDFNQYPGVMPVPGY